ncbi:hypothetical protein BJ742DRAFT_671422 [Cladochytrium replicatum]|nr:hypothetical protein BJ742DRAFT_671422 [Cladochytrium replicatum]
MSAGNQHTLARPLLQAPIPAMHWSRVKARGAVKPPASLRAHSMNLVTSDGLLLVFGGCDAKSCFGDLYVFDAETMVWSKPRVTGDLPEPCRAHSAVLVNDKLYIFGGGDGPDYFSTLHVLDIPTYNWSRLDLPNTPSPRRAHTAWAYENCMYVYAGGDGVQALDDLYCLDTETLQWRHLQTFWEGEPQVSQNPRGYHTATLIGHKVLVFGGSDGRECFSDVRLLDLTTLTWQVLSTDRVVPRLAHTATQVGSYLFVLGGHDGVSYNNEVLLLNLVTMSWEARRVFGTLMPSPRGYHSAVLYDSRLYVFGGYDGADVFGDMWVLDLSACAYLPQITSFDIASDVQMS